MSQDLRQQIKKSAAEKGCSMASIVRRAMKAFDLSAVKPYQRTVLPVFGNEKRVELFRSRGKETHLHIAELVRRAVEEYLSHG